MASELYNVIDALSREKGIDPQIVVSAVEDAIVVATRKYYKTQENLRAELDKESADPRLRGAFDRGDADQIEDPLSQITLDDAKRVDPAAEIGASCAPTRRLTCWGALRPAGQAGHLPEQSVKPKRHYLQRVHRRVGEVITPRQAPGRSGPLSLTWAGEGRMRGRNNRAWSRLLPASGRGGDLAR